MMGILFICICVELILNEFLLLYRQVSEDIYHMERQLAELKRQQESSQGSGVGGR